MKDKLTKSEKKRSKEEPKVEVSGGVVGRRGSSSSREFHTGEEDEVVVSKLGGRRGSSSSREFQHEGSGGEEASILSDSSYDERGRLRGGSKTAGSSSGVSSDLSDSDNDYKVDSDNDSPDYKEQFIESGIFEEEEMEMKRMVNKTKEQTLCEAGTQTLEVDQ